MRSAKKTGKKRIKLKLDSLVSQIVRRRGRCERCGKRENLQAAHVFPRDNMAVRYDIEDNLLCLCGGCHLFWAHKQPILFAEWVKERLGQERYDRLRERAGKIRKWTEAELEELYERLSKV